MRKRTICSLLFTLLFAGGQAFATAPYTEFYVQTTGSNLNAGSTTDNAAVHTYVSATTNGGWNASTGVFVVASGNPQTDGVAVGQFASIYVTSGATVATFVSRITARDTTSITVSLTAVAGTPPATDTTGGLTTLKVGGAWQGPNGAVGFPFSFVAPALNDGTNLLPRVNIKKGTYSVTAPISDTLSGPIVWQGYDTAIGDCSDPAKEKPVIDGGTSGTYYVLFQFYTGGTYNTVIDLVFDHNGGTGSNQKGIYNYVGPNTFIRTVVRNIHGFGISINATATFNNCEVYGCSSNGWTSLAGLACTRCNAHDNGGTGYSSTASGMSLTNCIADSNTGDGANCSSSGGMTLLNCDFYNNGSDGFEYGYTGSGGAYFFISNCNFVKNGHYGINVSDTAYVRYGRVHNCGFGSGTQANVTADTVNFGAVEIAGSVTYAANQTPWVDPANGDFRITLATAKNAGLGAFTSLGYGSALTVGYPDIGAAQHLTTATATETAFGYTQ